MIQIQDLHDAYARRKRDVSDVDTEVFIEWVKFTVDYLFPKLQKLDPERFVLSEVYTVVELPSSEDLPVDFDNIRNTSCGLFDEDGRKLSDTNYGNKRKGFYLGSSQINFTGDENEMEEDWTLRYMPLSPVLTSMSDYLTVDGTDQTPAIFETKHIQDLINALDVLYEQWAARPEDESIADFRFIRSLGNLFDNYSRSVQVSVMPNPSNDF